MPITFGAARNVILMALFDLTHSEDVQEYFSAVELKERRRLEISGVIISRVSHALAEDGLVQVAYDPNDDGDTTKFRITDEGLFQAEILSFGSDDFPFSDSQTKNPKEIIVVSESAKSAEVDKNLENSLDQIRKSNSFDKENNDWVLTHLRAGIDLFKLRKMTAAAVKSLILTPLSTAWKAVAEEKIKALLLYTATLLRNLIGW
jgi:hypothetical protein